MRVALTFDAEHPDRPTVSGVEERLLDVLDDLEVRATFFVQGRWAEAFPSTARRMAARHLVGNHSHYHCRMPLLSDQGLSADISSAESAIRRHVKVDPRPWFRCPFGAGAGDPRIIEALERRGYRHVGWDVSSSDWKRGRTAAGIVRDVAGQIGIRRGGIVLMHSWPSVTLRALPSLIDQLRLVGATFVGVDEMPIPSPDSVL